ncbi:TIGR03089 family protein [Trujillonella endophytica]|uniref:TIGR03089 family protein n=1 Tax=Trujillonella endophytica TaxID=673521 RepID=A0A1H8RVT5_9ACTN|nr:TIGR03089 family protein [Trujillella endophytica]SEO70561.1 TIGR03089 family protein [Trujillella endophytica]
MRITKPSTPPDLLRAALRRAPAAPLLTHYDDVAASRVELSATTFANWVAKTANLLQEEFDVGPGSRVALVLPAHWQTAAVLMAAWSCGATVFEPAAEDDGALADADVVLADQGRLGPLEEMDVPELLGLSLHPMGAGMTGYAGPARDFAIEVRTQGDVFTPWQPPEPTAPGLLVGGLELTLEGIVDTAAELAGRLGIGEGDRILVDTRTAAEAGPVAWLLAPLAAGASVVLVTAPDLSRLPRRATDERVTATLGTRIEGIRELGRPT